MAALIAQESGGVHIDPKTGRLLRNQSSGALGITQVIPDTGENPGFGVAPLRGQSKEEYIRFGREYLSAMLRRYGGDQKKALAAYNWGPGKVDAAISQLGSEWLTAAPDETKNYVENVSRNASIYGAMVPKIRGASGGSGGQTVDAEVILNFKDKSGNTVAPSAKVRIGAAKPQSSQ
jgi:hypothetical protein